MTRRLGTTERDLAAAAGLLHRGEIVAIPTETVYGLAARFDNPEAVAAVFHAKARPADDPLIVHLGSEMIADHPVGALERRGLIRPLSAPQRHTTALLVAACWPGPLTLVLPRGAAIHDAITAGLPEVALRVPSHPVAQALLNATGLGLVAPSANRFGRISPTTAEAVLSELDGRIAAVVDGGPCQVGVESTVLRVRPDGGLDRLRPGAVTDDRLAAITGHTPDLPRATEGPSPSPGHAASHYAPATPLDLAPAVGLDDTPRALALLAWREAAPLRHALTARGHHVVADATLAPDGDPVTAAQRLYAALRSLDTPACDAIVAEGIPEGSGLLDALRDRLRRAAHKSPPATAYPSPCLRKR